MNLKINKDREKGTREERRRIKELGWLATAKQLAKYTSGI